MYSVDLIFLHFSSTGPFSGLEKYMKPNSTLAHSKKCQKSDRMTDHTRLGTKVNKIILTKVIFRMGYKAIS